MIIAREGHFKIAAAISMYACSLIPSPMLSKSESRSFVDYTAINFRDISH